MTLQDRTGLWSAILRRRPETRLLYTIYTTAFFLSHISRDLDKTMETTAVPETTAIPETTAAATPVTEMATPGQASRVRPREESSPTGDTPPPHRMPRALSPVGEGVSVGSGQFTLNPNPNLNPNPSPNPSPDPNWLPAGPIATSIKLSHVLQVATIKGL